MPCILSMTIYHYVNDYKIYINNNLLSKPYVYNTVKKIESKFKKKFGIIFSFNPTSMIY